MSYWSIIACFTCIPLGMYAGTTRISKACFGSGGRACTFHSISCKSPHRISISEAYFTDNMKCGQGIPNCKNISLDNVTEHGYHRFEFHELFSVMNECSSLIKCSFQAPRRSEDHPPLYALTFSVVKYQCVDKMGETDGNGTDVGAAVGGVVASVLLVVIIVITTMCYLRKRRGNKNEKSANHQDQETQRKPRDTSQSHYQEIDDSQIRGRLHNYDYATADGIHASPNSHAYFTIEPITGPNVQHNPASTPKEDDYDHIGDKPSALSSNYDTTASVAQIVGTRANSREDDYGYNCLQEVPGTKTVQNDYDTTTAAGKAVEQVGRNDDKNLNSPYDAAAKMVDRSGDYALARPI